MAENWKETGERLLGEYGLAVEAVLRGTGTREDRYQAQLAVFSHFCKGRCHRCGNTTYLDGTIVVGSMEKTDTYQRCLACGWTDREPVEGTDDVE